MKWEKIVYLNLINFINIINKFFNFHTIFWKQNTKNYKIFIYNLKNTLKKGLVFEFKVKLSLRELNNNSLVANFKRI